MTGQGKNSMDELLAASMKELAVHRPIEKITIKEITDKAGVIRPTFYNHFQDKYELLEWIIKKELLEPIQPLLVAGMVTEGMVLLFTNMEKDKAFYAKAVRLEGPVPFEQIAQKCATEVLLSMIVQFKNQKPGKREWLTPEMIAKFYAQAICFAIVEWVRMGMVVPPREMAETYEYMISHSMHEVLQEL